jgi:hypothetical protein
VARYVKPKNAAERLHNELEVQREVNLRLQDRIDDIMVGIGIWKQTSSGAWTNHDEALLRWVEHNG